VLDVVFIAVALAFFGLGAVFVRGCAWIAGRGSGRREEGE
jgi:hypothetical protein